MLLGVWRREAGLTARNQCSKSCCANCSTGAFEAPVIELFRIARRGRSLAQIPGRSTTRFKLTHVLSSRVVGRISVNLGLEIRHIMILATFPGLSAQNTTIAVVSTSCRRGAVVFTFKIPRFPSCGLRRCHVINHHSIELYHRHRQ